MRFNMIMTYSALCAVGLMAAGCSSLPWSKKEEPKPVVVNNVPNTPEWFYATEASGDKDITVTATDVSKDMQFAIDKATLNAKIQLAERLKSDVDSLMRESSTESGYGVKDVEKEIDRVSKVRISQAIGFFKRDKLAVIKEGDHYRAFVMFKLSLEDARRLTHKSDSKNREDKFKELDAPVSMPTTTPSPVDVKPLQ